MRAKPPFTQAIGPKIFFNVGACLDIPTGFIVTGKKGERIINGGLGYTFGVVGIGNNFKSTVLHYVMLQAANRVLSTRETFMSTYDTEVNMMPDALLRFVNDMEYIDKEKVFDESGGLWNITDKTVYFAEEWISILQGFIANKLKEKSNKVPYGPFIDRDKKDIELYLPDFVEIDSFTDFETSDIADSLKDNNINDSSTNTIYMKQGLIKTKFLGILPRLCVSSNTYFLFTGQLSKEINIATGPAGRGPANKKVENLKNGDVIKGVSNKFLFLLYSCYNAYSARPYINSGTKLPEFPSDNKRLVYPKELNIVKLTQLRSKSGPTGYTIEMLISQTEGVLPTLTEFLNIKDSNRFGISGSNLKYHLDLYPDQDLSRTTVRGKISTDKKLARAINITSELEQMIEYWPQYNDDGLYCTPEELYADIKELGYDWDILLQTRGWWSIDQYTHPIPFLSTFDLLRMRVGLYTPYFLDKDKKPISKYTKNLIF